MPSTLEETRTDFVVVSGRDTLDEIRGAIEKNGASYVVVVLPDGTFAARSVFDEPRPLSADLQDQEALIGEEALAALTPAQLPDLFPPCQPIYASAPESEVQRKLDESGGCTVELAVTRVLHQTITGPAEPAPPPSPAEPPITASRAAGYAFAIPTMLPGEKRVFGGRKTRGPRICPACGHQFRHYKPVVEEGRVTGYACPYDDCGHLKGM